MRVRVEGSLDADVQAYMRACLQLGRYIADVKEVDGAAAMHLFASKLILHASSSLLHHHAATISNERGSVHGGKKEGGGEWGEGGQREREMVMPPHHKPPTGASNQPQDTASGSTCHAPEARPDRCISGKRALYLGKRALYPSTRAMHSSKISRRRVQR